jgi:hypothetical protein
VFLGFYPFYSIFMFFGWALFALYEDNHAGIPLCKVEPFLDVTNIYYYLKGHDRQKKLPKETKSLATICEELLSVFLFKVSVDKMSYLHFWNLNLLEVVCTCWGHSFLSTSQESAEHIGYTVQNFVVLLNKAADG